MTRPKRGDDAEVQRSIELENAAAVILAEHGYQVHQNPTPEEIAAARQTSGDSGNPRSKPDYLIEGRVFDCYSPTKPDKNVRGIHSQVKEKVVLLRQTQRAVVNLADWSGDMGALRRQFEDWPIPGLKELKVVTRSGDIIQIDLPRGTD
ncbi:CdiA C-terminal domain-containing protein [Paractinoplanes tereljensis]|uniref:CdiA C-terminal domain-containing protein n=1 Tax=Paractinoplanes tereljensis TaxID=571912 RepID=UPI001EF3075C|nr:hypothetical protein [Actinoplanes tereljensis]